MVKAGLMMVLFWCLWFSAVGNRDEHRRQLARVLIVTILGLFVAKILALTLPFRPRPIHVKGFEFILPHSVHSKTLEFWSSFPSDHATFFLILALGFYSISKSVGWFSLIYSFVIILIPRIYLGFHYPTDILGGLVVGFGIFQLTKWPSLLDRCLKPVFGFKEKKSGLFYGVLFFITYQSAVLFEDLRKVGEYSFKLIKIVLGL